MSRHRQEQSVASLEQMRGSSRPFNTDGSASCAPASAVPTAMEAMDEEAEEAVAELDATDEPSVGEEPSGGDTSAEEAATQATPQHAIRYSYCGVEFYLQLNDFHYETTIFHLQVSSVPHNEALYSPRAAEDY
jgi:hypothetical protein